MNNIKEKKCCCGGKYPTLKNHTVKECWTDCQPAPINNIEQAIKDAVEKGGWMGMHTKLAKERVEEFPEIAWCDLSFWQALGNARGWQECVRGCFRRNDDVCGGWHRKEYLENWHRFIDHLAEGKDAESFFATLV